MSTEREAPSPERTSPVGGSVIWALVLLGAIVPPIAISCGFWLIHRTAGSPALGPPLGGYEASATSIPTVVTTVAVALALQAAVGIAFLGWLHRARTNAEALSRSRHRDGPGWALGAWFVPVVNLVLPRAVVADVLRASRPDGDPPVWPVNAWWAATLLARCTHTAAWVTLIATAVGSGGSSGVLVATVIHSVGTFCSVVAGLLLGTIVVDISDGQRRQAADPVVVADENAVPDGEPPAPALPRDEFTGLASWFGFVLSRILRSAAPLLLLGAVSSAVSAVDLLTQRSSVEESRSGLWLGSTDYGIGPARHLLIGGADWTSQATALTAYAVTAITASAAMVVVLRLASTDVSSVLVGLRVAVRRAPALIGWVLVAVAMALTGLLLLVVPGVYVLIVVMATLVPVVVLEGRGIRRCFQLVRGRFWPTAVRCVVMVLVSQAWWFIAYGVAFQVVEQPLVSVVLYTVLGTPAWAFAVTSVAAMYAELAFHENRRAEARRELAGAPVPPAGALGPSPPRRAAEAPATISAPAARRPRGGVGTGAAAAPTTRGGPVGNPQGRFLLVAVGAVLLPAGCIALAVGAVLHLSTGAPLPDWLPLPRPAAAEASGPPAAPTGADVLAALLERSRRDGSGTFSVDEGAGMPMRSRGRFHYDGDAVSVRAEHSDFEITGSTVIGERRWVEWESLGSGERIWEECRPDNSEFCEFAGYMSDFADPLQLLRRAGDAARLTSTAPQVADGKPVTRYEFELDADRAMRNESDPFWRERFDNTWLQVGRINLWVDPEDRILQMTVGHVTGEHCTITYDFWGVPLQIEPPATNGPG